MERHTPYIDVGVKELRPGVAGEHIDNDHLTPLLHINQQVAKFSIILVDQIDSLWAHLFKRHHNTAGYQLHVNT